MTNVILVAHILIAIVLTIVILLQRSEGGALGIGGGSGGGLMSGRGVAGALTRTTIVFGAVFFISSLTLTTLATRDGANSSDPLRTRDAIPAPQTPETDELGLDSDGIEDILNAEGDILADPASALSQQPGTDGPQQSDPAEEDDQK